MSKANKQVTRRFFDEVFNKGKIEVIDEIVAESAIEHEDIPGIEGSGPEMMKQAATILRTAFPDLHMEVLDLIADEDRVAARISINGSHQGQLFDIPATGKKVQFEGMDFFRFEDGLVQEHWPISDNLALLQQLGVLPED